MDRNADSYKHRQGTTDPNHTTLSPTDYSVEREHAGLRRLAGYGVSITRGAASAMMFTYASLVTTMSRNTLTFFRETFLHRFIPFDNFHDMHKYVAFWALLFTSTLGLLTVLLLLAVVVVVLVVVTTLEVMVVMVVMAIVVVVVVVEVVVVSQW